MKKILFTVCTHGNEQVGLWLLHNFPQGYNSKYTWQTVLSNPKAAYMGVRYTESDLNRSFNISNPKTYEEKRARELTPIIQSYDVLYDVHQAFTQDDMEDCIFVNKIDAPTLRAIEPLAAKYVILDDNPEYNGHFATSVANVGITIEYARSGDYPEETGRLKKDFLNIVNNKPQKINRIFMKTYMAVPNYKRYRLLNLNNFVPLEPYEKTVLGIKDKGVYYPIFVNGYPDYYCFLNKEIQV